MILGIGSDLTEIGRIRRTLDRHGDRFVGRVFSEAERARAAGRRDPAPTLAKRWAAKEACAKALGCGIAEGVHLRDISVENDAQGRPVLVLRRGARARLDLVTPPGHVAVLHLSMTDDPPFALAFVVIEARPAATGT